MREGLIDYKNHISIDHRHGLIRRMKVTDVSRHD